MANALTEIIKSLENQGKAVARALAALHEIGDIDAGAAQPEPAATKKATRKGRMTPAGRKRLSEALRKRWAAKKAAAEGTPAVATKPTRKGGMTAAGRKRLSEALRQRWAAKRAAAAAGSPPAVAKKSRGRRAKKAA